MAMDYTPYTQRIPGKTFGNTESGVEIALTLLAQPVAGRFADMGWFAYAVSNCSSPFFALLSNYLLKFRRPALYRVHLSLDV
jgi:hypothetical protein